MLSKRNRKSFNCYSVAFSFLLSVLCNVLSTNCQLDCLAFGQYESVLQFVFTDWPFPVIKKLNHYIITITVLDFCACPMTIFPVISMLPIVLSVANTNVCSQSRTKVIFFSVKPMINLCHFFWKAYK